MKKYKLILKMIFATIALSSCTAMLDEVPISTLTPDNLFTTVADAESASNGMYEGLIFTDKENTRYGLWSVTYPAYGWGMMGTDIWSLLDPTSIRSKTSNYTLTATDEQVEVVWNILYSVINRANTIIGLVGNIKAEEDVINHYIADARFIRAFCYMDLVQFFGGIPLRLLPTTSIESDLSSPRISEKEVWAQIISDLEFAEQHLRVKVSPGKASKWAAKGLLAKAYLTRGGYPTGNYSEPEWFDKAAKKAYEVISQSGKSLNPTTRGSDKAFREYGNQFLVSGENSPESLFELQFQELDYGSGWGFYTISANKGWDNTNYGNFYGNNGGTVVGSDFALSFHDADIRFKWSIGPFKINKTTGTRAANSLDSWMPYKHRWETVPGNAWKSSMNAVVLRMADVYLLFAEASNEATGDPNDKKYGMSAYDAINVVRNRAQIPLLNDTYLTKDSPYGNTDMLYGMSFSSFDKKNSNYDGRHEYYTGSLKERFAAAVLLERAWELCFERHRWFDLKRTGKLLEYSQKAKIVSGGKLSANAIIDPIDKSIWLRDAELPKPSTIVYLPNAIKEHHLYMPIPDVEIELNPALGQAKQNPGY